MDVSFVRIGIRLGVSLCCFSALMSRQADAQLSGLFQTAPGAVATYRYQANGIQAVMLPVDLTVSFSNDNPTSALSATILKPIIGAKANGNAIYPIATYFPMRVEGTSSNGRDFHGDLLGTQYLFDWKIEPASGGELLFNGHVYWAGGRIEDTTIDNLHLIPSLPGDYNQDGALDAADYILWRKYEGTTRPLANDPIGGTIGPNHYTQWRSRFGQTAGGGAGSSPSNVPEPASILLAMSCLAILICHARRQAADT